MAVIEIAHKPELTKEQVMAAFARQFGSKYKVEEWKGPMKGLRDFTVVKSPWVGVSLKLDQSSSATKIVYTGYSPAWWARVLGGALVPFIITSGLTGEVRQFIETAPEFHQATPASP